MGKTRVTFPDRNLESVIRDTIGKPEGSIYTSDLEYINTLDGESRGISDLTGLEHCVNLQWLYLHTNNISDISALAELSDLKKLDLIGNNISDISALASLTNLEHVHLDFNNISDISPLAGLINLKYLDITKD